MRFSIPLSTGSFILLVCPGTASATTYTIAPDGTGDFVTIQDGLSGASEGSIIELLSGVFSGPGNRELHYWGKNLVVRSRDGDPRGCVIDCEGQTSGVWFINDEPITALLEGVTIRNGRGNQAGALRIINASPTIRNCVFQDNVCDPGAGAGGIYADRSGSLIERCVFERNAVTGLGAGGMACVSSPAPTVRECVFTENRADTWPFINGGAVTCDTSNPVIDKCTIRMNSAWPGCGGILLTLSSPVIRDCTITENSGLVAGGIASVWGSGPSVSNTIVAFNQGEVGVSCEPGIALSCCDLFGNNGGDWVGCLEGQQGSGGNLNLDPLFCGLELGDLTLREDSPCAGGNNPGCGQVGAWGVGCGLPTRIESVSWGQIKALFAR